MSYTDKVTSNNYSNIAAIGKSKGLDEETSCTKPARDGDKYFLRFVLPEGDVISVPHADLRFVQYQESTGFQLFYPNYIIRIYGLDFEDFQHKLEQHKFRAISSVSKERAEELKAADEKYIITDIQVIFESDYNIGDMRQDFMLPQGRH